jgi:hypothetical protein
MHKLHISVIIVLQEPSTKIKHRTKVRLFSF